MCRLLVTAKVVPSSPDSCHHDEGGAKFLRNVRRLLVTAGVVPSSPDSCHPDEGGARFLRNVRRLLVTASVVPSSQILVTMMKEALGSSETCDGC
jgi:hypothetical protein